MADFRRLPSRAVPKPPTVARPFGTPVSLSVGVGSCRAVQAVCLAVPLRFAWLERTFLSDSLELPKQM